MNFKGLLRKIVQTFVLAGFFGFASLAGATAFDDFFRALALDDAGTVRQLLNRGFPVNARDDKGQPALVLALRAPAPQVLELLVAQPGIDLEMATPAGETPLLIAALVGDAAWTRRLADLGAHLTSPSGWTALHYAASSQNPEAVAVLLTRGAIVDARAPGGLTPLMMAARYGDQRNVDLLLARGADPALLDARGASAADLARLAERDRLADRLARLPKR